MGTAVGEQGTAGLAMEVTVTCLLLLSALWLPGSESDNSDLKKLQDPRREAALRPKRGLRLCFPNPCKHQGVCQVVEGKPNCTCNAGFTGAFCQDVVLKLQCEDEHMKMMVRQEVFDQLKIPLARVHLKNRACKVSEKEEDGAVFFAATLMDVNYTRCGSVIQRNRTHVSYTNVMESDRETLGVISRSSLVRVHFSCIYSYEHVVQLPFPVAAIDTLVKFVIKEGEFNVSMALYETSAYLHPYRQQPPALPLSELLYILLQLEGQSHLRYFLLSVEDCWATPAADPGHEVQHQLIVKGCPRDETVTYLNAVGNSTMAKFSFQMFQFVNHSEVFLHCRVRLCLLDGAEPCVKQCPRRLRKRALEEDYKKIVSLGPIHLLASPRAGARDAASGTNQQDLWGLHLWVPGALAMLIVAGLFGLVAVAKALKK
ncbi:uromodulin-like [Pelodiscus sinensis]|uniref:uromodulin-like n=1 Tax=Pelodiscus sinensis TaxID=13735 RepID=UPI003F6B2082